jgi:hypothetical protein
MTSGTMKSIDNLKLFKYARFSQRNIHDSVFRNLSKPFWFLSRDFCIPKILPFVGIR